MHVTEQESVELASYRSKDVDYDCFMVWKDSRGENVASINWKVFDDAFMDKFFMQEMREEKVEEFMNLR